MTVVEDKVPETTITVDSGRRSPINDIPTIPVENQIDIGFSNLSYNITVGTGKKAHNKKILKNVSSHFRAGRLTVILGASGAGKTSLLNVIAGETRLGKLTGSIALNGKASSGSEIKKVSGFVQQDDVVLGTMTVIEAITMSAKLRLPHTMTAEEKDKKVSETICMLGLQKCKDTIIGTATEKGISGGERKRVCMAMELVTNPPVLFADEPSSGLDTYTAFAVVKLMKELAASGRTIVATLHQPSSEIFHLIDDLCIMSQGEIMYFGEAEKAVPYFAREGYPCPQFSNPADFFFMEILNTSMETTFADKAPRFTPEERIPKLLEIWKKSPENAQIQGELDRPKRVDGVSTSSFKYVSRFVDQFPVLYRRAAKNALRNKLIVRAKLAQTIFFGVLMGLIYLNIPGRKFASQTQDRAGVIFFLCVNQVMASAMGVLSVFAAEKQVFRREFAAGYYSLPSYFSTKVAVELPFQILMPFLLVTIMYWMIGLQNDGAKYIITAGFTVILAQCGTAIGMLAACAFDELAVALTIVPVILLPLMIFSGLFVNTGNIPVWLDWIKYLSPMKYGFVGMIKNEFTGLQLCPSSADTPQLQHAGCVSGQTAIDNFGIADQGSILLNFIVLLAIWILLLLMSYLALWRIVRNAKHVDITPPSGDKDKTEQQNLLTNVTAEH